MLYVGCGNCRATIPLVCTGQFMPHIPLPIAASQAGVSCGFCGLLAPVFTCGYCWTSQALYVPGTNAAPTPGFGASRYVAPAVDAPGNAIQAELSDRFANVMEEFAGGVANSLGESFGGSGFFESTWFSG